MSKYARLSSLFFLGVLTLVFFSWPSITSAFTTPEQILDQAKVKATEVQVAAAAADGMADEAEAAAKAAPEDTAIGQAAEKARAYATAYAAEAAKATAVVEIATAKKKSGKLTITDAQAALDEVTAIAKKASTPAQTAYGCTGDTTLGGTITFYMCVTTRFVTVIAIIIIMVTGLLYIISGFKPEMATTAKTILGTTITGLIFMYMISYIVNLMSDAKIMSTTAPPTPAATTPPTTPPATGR